MLQIGVRGPAGFTEAPAQRGSTARPCRVPVARRPQSARSDPLEQEKNQEKLAEIRFFFFFFLN